MGCLNDDHLGIVNNEFIVYNKGNLVGGTPIFRSLASTISSVHA